MSLPTYIHIGGKKRMLFFRTECDKSLACTKKRHSFDHPMTNSFETLNPLLKPKQTNPQNAPIEIPISKLTSQFTRILQNHKMENEKCKFFFTTIGSKKQITQNKIIALHHPEPQMVIKMRNNEKGEKMVCMQVNQCSYSKMHQPKKKNPKRKKNRAKIRNSLCGPKCKNETENPERNE